MRPCRWILLLIATAAPLTAQAGVRVGVEPGVVTVGEPFRVVVESLADRGAPMELTVRADTGGRFEPVAGGGSDPAAGLAWTALVAWRTGPADTLAATLRIGGRGGRAIDLTVTTPVVRSVLPADSGRIPPRPPHDVFGPDRRPLWGVIGGSAVAALLLAALLLRRRRPSRGAPMVAGDPRREALASLQRVRDAGYLERGEIRRFHEETAEVLRVYAAGASSAWSRDLTTAELLARLREGAAPAVSSLAEVLEAADLAKFAGVHGDRDDALREWTVARAWVAGKEAA